MDGFDSDNDSLKLNDIPIQNNGSNDEEKDGCQVVVNMEINDAISKMTHVLEKVHGAYEEMQKRMDRLIAGIQSHSEEMREYECDLESRETSIKNKVSLLK
jgi:peptidoglycan hydrolase CwlO-like protein